MKYPHKGTFRPSSKTYLDLKTVYFHFLLNQTTALNVYFRNLK